MENKNLCIYQLLFDMGILFVLMSSTSGDMIGGFLKQEENEDLTGVYVLVGFY